MKVYDFTFFCGLSMTVSKYFTTSFWVIKAILTCGKAHNWQKQPVESAYCFGNILGKYRSEADFFGDLEIALIISY